MAVVCVRASAVASGADNPSHRGRGKPCGDDLEGAQQLSVGLGRGRARVVRGSAHHRVQCAHEVGRRLRQHALAGRRRAAAKDLADAARDGDAGSGVAGLVAQEADVQLQQLDGRRAELVRAQEGGDVAQRLRSGAPHFRLRQRGQWSVWVSRAPLLPSPPPCLATPRRGTHLPRRRPVAQHHLVGAEQLAVVLGSRARRDLAQVRGRSRAALDGRARAAPAARGHGDDRLTERRQRCVTGEEGGRVSSARPLACTAAAAAAWQCCSLCAPLPTATRSALLRTELSRGRRRMRTSLSRGTKSAAAAGTGSA